jgi:glycosyltransferase involved in cell wall biosynthesis
MADSVRTRSASRFDVVHLAHTWIPEDPRVRKEALVSAEAGARVAVVVLRGGRDGRAVSRHGRLTVIRLPSVKRRGPLLSYAMDYLDFIARCTWLLWRSPRFSRVRVVHIHTLPDFLIAAAAPARRRGARTILDLHEVFPEFVLSKFPGAGGRAGVSVARWLERWSRRRASVVFTVNHPIERLLRSRPARANERIVVVHNVADSADFGPQRLTSGVVSGDLQLSYHGTLTPLYGLPLAVRAVAEARAAGTPARLQIFGDGPDRIVLERLIAELGLGGVVTLHGSLPVRELAPKLAAAHAGIVPTRSDAMTRYALSTKLLEYVHLGVPLLLPRLPTYLEYFPEGTAWYFQPDDPHDAAAAIRAMAAASPAARVDRARAAQQAAAHLNWAEEAAKVRDVYRELLGATT